jgi:3-hydroxyisobutyrate dehydrogenase-like beta-hydroxyacid dehydrogenase
MIEGDYQADFPVGWALKDLDLVGAEAPGAAPLAGAIAQRWQELVRGRVKQLGRERGAQRARRTGRA